MSSSWRVLNDSQMCFHIFLHWVVLLEEYPFAMIATSSETNEPTSPGIAGLLATFFISCFCLYAVAAPFPWSLNSIRAASSVCTRHSWSFEVVSLLVFSNSQALGCVREEVVLLQREKHYVILLHLRTFWIFIHSQVLGILGLLQILQSTLCVCFILDLLQIVVVPFFTGSCSFWLSKSF